MYAKLLAFLLPSSPLTLNGCDGIECMSTKWPISTQNVWIRHVCASVLKSVCERESVCVCVVLIWKSFTLFSKRANKRGKSLKGKKCQTTRWLDGSHLGTYNERLGEKKCLCKKNKQKVHKWIFSDVFLAMLFCVTKSDWNCCWLSLRTAVIRNV